MPRHILDKPRDRDAGARPREYARIEREIAGEGKDPRVAALHRSRPAPKGASRTKAYQRIEKTRDE